MVSASPLSTVTTSEAVTIAGGTPTLLLETGATDRAATYVGGAACDVFSKEPARENVLFGARNFIATPHLDETEVDKSTLPLWQYHLREWHGLVFVSLHADPPPFDQWLQRHAAEMLRLERFGIGDLFRSRRGRRW